MKHLERTFIGSGLLAATIGAGMVFAGGKSQSGGFDNNSNNTTDASFIDNAVANTNSTKSEIVMDAGEIIAIIGVTSVVLGIRKPGRQRSTFQP